MLKFVLINSRASIAVDLPNDRFATCGGGQFEMHRLSNIAHIRTLESEKPLVLFPKDVAFSEAGTKLVTGTDRGMAVVYDSATGTVVQTLQYTKEGLVQPVTVSSPYVFATIHSPLDIVDLYLRRTPFDRHCGLRQ